MALIVGIRFHGGGKTYHFDASAVPEIKKGEYVIVETSRGQQLGQVVSFLDPRKKNGKKWKPILRAATSRDLVMRQIWEKKEEQVLESCRKMASEEKSWKRSNLSPQNSAWKVKTWFSCIVMKGMMIPNWGICLKNSRKTTPKLIWKCARIGPQGFSQDHWWYGCLRTGDPLLHRVHDRIYPDIDQNGKRTGHFSGPYRDHWYVRPACDAV